MRGYRFVSCLLGLLIAALSLTGCPAAKPTGTQFVPDPNRPARLLPTGDSLTVAMTPVQEPFRGGTETDLAVANFESPSGHEGRAFVHLPKGWLQMMLVVDHLHVAEAEMLFEWDVVRGDQTIQHVTARIVPGDKPEILIDGKLVELDKSGSN